MWLGSVPRVTTGMPHGKRNGRFDSVVRLKRTALGFFLSKRNP